MRNVLRGAAKFLMAFYVMTIICAFAWDGLEDENLYNSTDDVPFHYLVPGNWVGDNNWPVKVVPQVGVDENMNDPDTIKEGWSLTRLWELWLGFCLFGGH